MSFASIELRHLRYFVAVVEQGSFRGAALRLHVSQPPLTRQIHQLEDAIGVKLLIRRPRGVEATDAGVVFFEEARNVLSLIERGASRAKLAGLGQIGRLDVGVFGSAMFKAIPNVIQVFRSRYPQVEVLLHNLNRQEQIRALRERRLTVGFNRFFSEEPDLTWEVLQTEAIHVALYTTHPLAKQKRIALADIGDETLILYPRSPRPSFIEHMLRTFHERGISPKTIHEVDDVVTAVALVTAGLGVSLVTDSACNLRLPGIKYLPLRKEDQTRFDLCLIYRSDDDSRVLHAFLQLSRELYVKPSAEKAAPLGNASR
jgi:DNA-binding transcriptional LysR family regulator